MKAAGADREIDAAFARLAQARTRALLVGNDAFFNNRIEQIVALAARHSISRANPALKKQFEATRKSLGFVPIRL